MKGIFNHIALSLLLIKMVLISAHATDGEGIKIYGSYEDFKKGKSSYSLLSNKSSTTIWPTGILKYNDIKITNPDTSVIIEAKMVWAYRDHRKRLVRVHEGKHYRVLCRKGPIIYIIYSPTRVAHYFSKDLNSRIYRINKSNLREVYAYNPLLLNKITNLPKRYYLLWDKQNESYLLSSIIRKNKLASTAIF
jgi:hypothetical protein